MIITGMIDLDRIVLRVRTELPGAESRSTLRSTPTWKAGHGTYILNPPSRKGPSTVESGNTFTGYQRMTAPGVYTVIGKAGGAWERRQLEGMKHMVTVSMSMDWFLTGRSPGALSTSSGKAEERASPYRSRIYADDTTPYSEGQHARLMAAGLLEMPAGKPAGISMRSQLIGAQVTGLQ